MALIRWEPFREMETIQRQMNRLFEQMITPGDGERLAEGVNFIPAAEIEETPEDVRLRMEVPGIDPKDLDVKVTEDAVSITGERKTEFKEEERGMRRSEFRYGRFQRILPLPSRVQQDKVNAEFRNGVISLTLPKAEEEKHKVVTVKLAGEGQQPQISSSKASK
ncbi:MAG: Hsp20/alpha crystallin family protein [Leptolyngbyaceae bacterium]|nr:Hsp20/alpha crystallin family protein [Leptolyngbyaceae bacterium]